MENNKQPVPAAESKFTHHFLKYVNYFEYIVLIFVAISIGVLSLILLFEAFTDFYYFSTHSLSHIVGEMMFVLVLIELLNQVARQIKHQPITLTPFFFIGVIVSVRGILVTLMKVSMEGADIWISLLQIGTYAMVALIMVICYYLSSKIS